MTERLTPSRLRQNLYRILDRVAETGEPVEITRRGECLRITVSERASKLGALRAHPDYAASDLDALVHMDWSPDWRP